MAAPIPPQGNQQAHTERPLRIYSEQYLAGAPLPIGARTDTPTGGSGPPYVIAGGIYYPLRLNDWVITNRYTGHPIEVIGPEEYAERFGPQAAEAGAV